MYAGVMAALHNGMRVDAEGHRLYFKRSEPFSVEDFMPVPIEERMARISGRQPIEQKMALLGAALGIAGSRFN